MPYPTYQISSINPLNYCWMTNSQILFTNCQCYAINCPIYITQLISAHKSPWSKLTKGSKIINIFQLSTKKFHILNSLTFTFLEDLRSNKKFWEFSTHKLFRHRWKWKIKLAEIMEEFSRRPSCCASKILSFTLLSSGKLSIKANFHVRWMWFIFIAS